jgi:hypothetical protein
MVAEQDGSGGDVSDLCSGSAWVESRPGDLQP